MAGVNIIVEKLNLHLSYNHCIFSNIKLKKIKGGKKGGNYEGVDDGEIYRVMKFQKLN